MAGPWLQPLRGLLFAIVLWPLRDALLAMPAGVKDPPGFDEAWGDYRFFAHDAWDSVALTILWSGLHPPDPLERAYQRCCAAFEDLAIDEILAARLDMRSA